MTDQINWFLVEGDDAGRQGALGFLGDDIAVIALFDAAADPAALIATARSRPEVFARDPGIAQTLSRVSSEFPRALPLDSAWSAYFRPGIAMATRGADRTVHGGAIARILPRRGAEQALDQALSA